MKRRQKRLYPFTTPENPWSSGTNTTSGTISKVTWTVYKPNPFHGIDRIVFAVDEWGHRTLPRRMHRLFLGWLCDWWERRVTGGQSEGRADA